MIGKYCFLKDLLILVMLFQLKNNRTLDIKNETILIKERENRHIHN